MKQYLEKFHQQIKINLEEIRGYVEDMQSENDLHLISYFTYSINLAHDGNQENLCLGSYHIRNLSQKTITNPYICIKLPKDSPFTFTGKYIYKNRQSKVKNPGGWVRINEQENLEQFWLKPFEHQTIQPNETISFSDFQIKWTPTKAYAGSIMGFTYSEEHQEGIPAMNAINLSGTMSNQEDADDSKFKR